jgi:hypothetical protein
MVMDKSVQSETLFVTFAVEVFFLEIIGYSLSLSRVHVCSYNVGGHSPSDNLDAWLGLEGPETDLPTVIAVG